MSAASEQEVLRCVFVVEPAVWAFGGGFKPNAVTVASQKHTVACAQLSHGHRVSTREIRVGQVGQGAGRTLVPLRLWRL